jgi:hypothetical protein
MPARAVYVKATREHEQSTLDDSYHLEHKLSLVHSPRPIATSAAGTLSMYQPATGRVARGPQAKPAAALTSTSPSEESPAAHS